jgi:hypothetical protein
MHTRTWGGLGPDQPRPDQMGARGVQLQEEENLAYAFGGTAVFLRSSEQTALFRLPPNHKGQAGDRPRRTRFGIVAYSWLPVSNQQTAAGGGRAGGLGRRYASDQGGEAGRMLRPRTAVAGRPEVHNAIHTPAWAGIESDGRVAFGLRMSSGGRLSRQLRKRETSCHWRTRGEVT